MTATSSCSPRLDIARNTSSRAVLGTPLWVFVAPICLYAKWSQRNRRVLTVSPNGDREATQDAWVVKEICVGCGEVEDHQYIQWADEPVVTVECVGCGHAGEYLDAK